MFWLAILGLMATAEARPQGGGGLSYTMLRFGCSNIVIDRIDPLVNPGEFPSPHVHQIVGGNSFNVTMPYTDVSQRATCTSCTFAQDFSNYWTANVYFRARNGTYHRVPQMPNQQIGASNGGFTVYYTAPGGVGSVTAFKPGFRMLAGDNNRRTSTNLGRKMQSCYRCFSGPNFGGNIYAPCQDSVRDTETFPKNPCPGGIRSSVLFPICWDGKNLDSPNHQDHVAHPVDGPAPFAEVSGRCPASHPVKIPQVHYEVVWDTRRFNDKSLWPTDGSQPLVLSNGDTTGYGQHGDYVFGWQGDKLQHAMDNRCFGPTCNGLSTQNFPGAANNCKVKPVVGEDTEGWLQQLPGQNMQMPM